jgi:hypothetical protein
VVSILALLPFIQRALAQRQTLFTRKFLLISSTVKDDGSLRPLSIPIYGHVSINLLSWAENTVTNLYIYYCLPLSYLAAPFFQFFMRQLSTWCQQKNIYCCFYNVVSFVYEYILNQNTELDLYFLHYKPVLRK